jgi:GNAT superfamily N-acetyltransferase
MNSSADFVVERVPCAERARALQLLQVDDVADVGTCIVTDWLVWARAGEKVVAVAWAFESPGRVIHLVAPRGDPAGGPQAEALVLRYLDAQLREEATAKFIQLLLPVEGLPLVPTLQSLDFERITEVQFLASSLGAVTPWLRGQLRACEPSELASFTSVLAETLVESRDCRRLNAWRSTEDLITGYRASCGGRMGNWFFVLFEGETAGCLILDEPTGAARPLIVHYVGLIPKYRGIGLGREVLMAARRIGIRGGHPLMAAVDRSNAPANRAYASAGFRVVDRRQLWARQCADLPTFCAPQEPLGG